MHKLLLRDLHGSLEGRRVVLRLDLNVPLRDGVVSDDTRLDAVLPTLNALHDEGARTIVLSHLGRPGGMVSPTLSLDPVARRLSELLGRAVPLCPATRGPEVQRAAAAVQNGEVLLLENSRFEPGETKNDAALAEEWGALADVFVNDAFGTAHRAHASTEGIARVVRNRGGVAVAGPLMERELHFLSKVTKDPARPFVAVIGGAKISGKIDVVETLLETVDELIIGGAMANTFFLALGLEVGDSLVEEEKVDLAKEILDRGGEKVILPIDARVAGQISPDVEPRSTERTDVAEGERIGDIGPRSEALFTSVLERANTIMWNGPMGVFELAPFAQGTFAVAHALAAATDRGALTVVGGGDSAAAIEAVHLADKVSHVSTGGGASLEYLAGDPLPGVEALSDREKEGD
jgi:3-phosphoglycerate kinase